MTQYIIKFICNDPTTNYTDEAYYVVQPDVWTIDGPAIGMSNFIEDATIFDEKTGKRLFKKYAKKYSRDEIWDYDNSRWQTTVVLEQIA